MSIKTAGTGDHDVVHLRPGTPTPSPALGARGGGGGGTWGAGGLPSEVDKAPPLAYLPNHWSGGGIGGRGAVYGGIRCGQYWSMGGGAPGGGGGAPGVCVCVGGGGGY